MMKVNVEYGSKENEIEMYKKLNNDYENIKVNKILNKKQIKEIQSLLSEIYVSDNIYEYVSDIIEATRTPEKYGLENI
jgi:MoxR-like ATPase